MDAEHWNRVQAIFGEALELPPAERPAFLSARCADQPELCAEVESLLLSHDDAGEFLSRPVAEGLSEDVAPDLTGHTIGAFRLIEPIGRGGMGVVYRAERMSSEFTQQAAVKVLEAPLRTADVLRHFKTERQILASLRHPHIVTLLDGGVSPDGHSFLAMEYVDGVPITMHCATRRLALDERLQLVQRVCSAVQYAHQHGVVHRDLKPGNILVTPDGVPKVLDFGVAKLLDQSNPGADSTVTNPLRRALTPNYASPEQVRGLPVTTSCDIYALGVLLYELLTGVRPYDTTDQPLDEMLRLVTEAEPKRPSAAAGDAVPYNGSALRGDLDAIVLKAMSKEPARRYASPQELSEDLGRFLSRQPVLAREPSFGYLLAKTAQRHRAGFLAAAISIVALIAALGISLWERHLAVVERNRATARFNDVRQIADAMIYKIDSAVQPLPGSTPLRRQIVAEALVYLERLRSDPQRDDALSLEMARAYHRVGDVQGNQTVANLGDRDAAIASYRKAIDLLKPIAVTSTLHHEVALELGRVEISLATVLNTMDHAAAMKTSQEAAAGADALLRETPSDDGARRLVAAVEFQAAEFAPRAESLPHWIRAREMFDALLSEKPDEADRQRNVALSEKYIGAYYENTRDYPSALAHHERAQALDEARLRARPTDRMAKFDVAIDLSNIAYAEWQMGHRAAAATHYEQTLEMRQQMADSDPSDVLARSRVAYVHSRLADLYGELEQIAKALGHAREAARLGESMAKIDPAHAEMYAQDLQALASAEGQAGHAAASCAAYRQAHEVLTTLVSNTALEPNLAHRVQGEYTEAQSRVTGCGATKPRL
jgi:non-specific serine/threonine protein kinase/serine/threonine-protein kinase